jgi:hypothetical protein
VYPPWLTEALRRKVAGVGYAEDRRGRNWERLKDVYYELHPDFKNKALNTTEASED